MNRDKEDLFKTYRTAVAWGMYDEAARIQRQMLGQPSDYSHPALQTELNDLAEQQPSAGFLATLRGFFRRTSAA